MRERDYYREQRDLFRRVFLVGQIWQAVGDRELGRFGLTTKQWLLLDAVARAGAETPTLSETAAVYGSSRQNVKQIARQLESRGCLAFKKDPNDRRSVCLALTDEGRGLVESRGTDEELLDGLLWGLDDGELEKICAVLETLEDTGRQVLEAGK